jgi:hypothetical protein
MSSNPRHRHTPIALFAKKVVEKLPNQQNGSSNASQYSEEKL